MADIIESALRQFPSKAQTVCVEDLHIGDCIWLGEEFYIVNEDSQSRVAIPVNDIISFKCESFLSWGKSEIRKTLNETYMYNILDNILHTERPYDMLLGLKLQGVWDKVSILSPDEYKTYFNRVPDAFKEGFYMLAEVVSDETYIAEIKDGISTISFDDSYENNMPDRVRIKPIIILSNEAEVTLVEKNNAG